MLETRELVDQVAFDVAKRLGVALEIVAVVFDAHLLDLVLEQVVFVEEDDELDVLQVAKVDERFEHFARLFQTIGAAILAQVFVIFT